MGKSFEDYPYKEEQRNGVVSRQNMRVKKDVFINDGRN